MKECIYKERQTPRSSNFGFEAKKVHEHLFDFSLVPGGKNES